MFFAIMMFPAFTCPDEGGKVIDDVFGCTIESCRTSRADSVDEKSDEGESRGEQKNNDESDDGSDKESVSIKRKGRHPHETYEYHSQAEYSAVISNESVRNPE